MASWRGGPAIAHGSLREECGTRVRLRRLGLWAAERMRLRADAREAYAARISLGSALEPGEGYAIRTVLVDLWARGIRVTENEARCAMSAPAHG